MRVRHWFILLLTLPLTGCGGCGHSGDPRDAVADGQKADEHKPTLDLAVRLKAATTLPKRGELPPDLLAALQDDSPHVRRAAVFTVRRSGADAKTISAALTPLLKDKEPFLRVVAAETLWEADQDPEALATMKKVLRDGTDLRAATRAIQALGEVGPAAKDVAPELTALLKNPDPRLRVVIAEALTRIRYADVPALAEALAVSQMEDFQGGDEATARALARVFAALGKDAVAPLITMMKSGDAHQQKYAALAIAEVGQNGSDAVPALAALLRVRQYNTHQTALEVLAHLGPAAEPALLNILDLLDDEDPTTSHEAAVAVGSIGRPALQPLMIRLRSKKVKNDLATVALAQLGKDAIPSLIEALKSDEPMIRQRAALALAGMQSPPKEALPVIMALLKEWTEQSQEDAFGLAVGSSGFATRRRSSATVRQLVMGVGNFGSDAVEAIPILIPLLKDRSSELRLMSARALGAMGPAARRALPALRDAAADTENHYRAAIAAAATLVALPLDRKEDLPILMELLKNAQLPDEVRAKVVEIFGRLGPEATDVAPDLVKMLGSPTADRATVYLPQALGRIGEAALPQVVKAVQGKKAGWKQQAYALRYLGEPARTLALKWVTDEDEELRNVGVWLLGCWPATTESTAALLDALNDLNANVRMNAAGALYHSGVEARVAIPALAKRLLDPKAPVRFAAATSLMQYEKRAGSAVPALIDALKDDDKNVRGMATNALRCIGVGKGSVAALVAVLEAKGPGVREALQLLPDIGEDAKEAVPVLRELRKDERWEEPVLIALWHVAQDNTAGTRLLDRLRALDRSTRAQAVYAFGGKGLGATLAIPALCDALRDPDADVREAACVALGRIGAGGQAALPELMALLQKTESEWERRAVRESIVKMGSAAKAAAPALKALRKKTPMSEQVELNSILWTIAADEEAITALAVLLEDREACAWAARALADIGPPAKAAVPALRAQRANREQTLAAGARIDEALRKIEAK